MRSHASQHHDKKVRCTCRACQRAGWLCTWRAGRLRAPCAPREGGAAKTTRGAVPAPASPHHHRLLLRGATLPACLSRCCLFAVAHVAHLPCKREAAAAAAHAAPSGTVRLPLRAACCPTPAAPPPPAPHPACRRPTHLPPPPQPPQLPWLTASTATTNNLQPQRQRRPLQGARRDPGRRRRAAVARRRLQDQGAHSRPGPRPQLQVGGRQRAERGGRGGGGGAHARPGPPPRVHQRPEVGRQSVFRAGAHARPKPRRGSGSRGGAAGEGLGQRLKGRGPRAPPRGAHHSLPA